MLVYQRVSLKFSPYIGLICGSYLQNWGSWYSHWHYHSYTVPLRLEPPPLSKTDVNWGVVILKCHRTAWSGCWISFRKAQNGEWIRKLVHNCPLAISESLIQCFLKKTYHHFSWKEYGYLGKNTHRIHGAAIIYGNIYHQYTPNVSIYTMHGSYGLWCIIGRPYWKEQVYIFLLGRGSFKGGAGNIEKESREHWKRVTSSVQR